MQGVPVESTRHLRGYDSTVTAEASLRGGCRERVVVVGAGETGADGLGGLVEEAVVVGVQQLLQVAAVSYRVR